MRIHDLPILLIVVLAEALAACGTGGKVAARGPRLVTDTQVVAAPAKRIALFVRDRTGRASALTSFLTDELRQQGMQCEIIRVPPGNPPPWKADAPLAKATGAPFAVRISILGNTEEQQAIHRPVVGSRRASGIVVGPMDSPSPNDSPDARNQGGWETVDLGDDVVREDLRIDISVSVRRTEQDRPLATWRAAEGSLRMLSEIAPRSGSVQWNGLYRALAERLATMIATTLSAAH